MQFLNKTTERCLSTHQIILDTVLGWCRGKTKWLKNYGLILCELNASAIQNAVAYESESATGNIETSTGSEKIGSSPPCSCSILQSWKEKWACRNFGMEALKQPLNINEQEQAEKNLKELKQKMSFTDYYWLIPNAI